MVKEVWYYPNSKIVKVVDADTYDIDLDHGNRFKRVTRIRLAGVDAAESYGKYKTALGEEAKQYCIKLLLGKIVTVKSLEMDGKYGRLIADIILPDNKSLVERLVDKLLKRKIAESPTQLIAESSTIDMVKELLSKHLADNFLSKHLVDLGYAKYVQY